MSLADALQRAATLAGESLAPHGVGALVLIAHTPEGVTASGYACVGADMAELLRRAPDAAEALRTVSEERKGEA